MKRPSINIDKEAIVDFLIKHVEKMAAAVIALFVCSLAWAGIDAVRTKTPGKEKQPPAILEQANLAAANIQTAKHPPEDILRKAELSKAIEPWRVPEMAGSPSVALLNRPLFEEKAKRTKPAVLPIEDLRAVAGIAVLAVKNDPAANPGRNAADLDTPEPPRKPKPRGGRGRGDLREAEQNPAGSPPVEMPATAAPSVRLAPYCIVTGLIPLAKQTDEYRQRFESAGFRDPKRDVPLWSDYLIERAVVEPDGSGEKWVKIDVKAAARLAQKEWTAVQAEQIPPEFLLAAAQVPGTAVGYFQPLPQSAGEPWGTEAMHPWFVEQLKKIRARQAAAAKAAAEGGGPAAAQDQAGVPDFQSPIDAPPQPGSGAAVGSIRPSGEEADPAAPEYRIFRFVDTAVEIGKTYRYRMRLSIWNPNYNLPAQYLSDPAIAKEAKLPSPPGNVTAPVRVPGTTTMLVRTLRKADAKRFKPGMVELMVLGKSQQTGNYSLRSLLTETGGLANVDKQLNRPGDARTRGEDIVTDRVLIDVRGKQEDRSETRTNKPTPPPEPLEMLFLRDDGTFEIASSADSQLLIGRFFATLPAGEEVKAGARDRMEQPGPVPNNPFGSPFRP